MKISLDTNAILDLCYRYYTQQIFPTLWENLHASLSAKQISFYVCECVVIETRQQIINYHYDENIFDKFLNDFRVKVIGFAQYQMISMQLQQKLVEYPIAKNSRHITEHDYADLSIIALAKKEQATVITSEQKAPNLDWNNKASRTLKVPNICEKFDIQYGNWLIVFKHLGLQH